jgi:hypothetical protein
VDLAGFCPRIWIYGIPELVLIPKTISSRRQSTQPGRWAALHKSFQDKEYFIMRMNVIICLVIFVFVFTGCQSNNPTVTSGQQAPNGEIEDIHVVNTESVESRVDTETFGLPNCGGTGEIHQTLGTHASIFKSVTVGVKATIKGGGEVEIPETVKLKLEIAVEASYQETYETASSRLDTIDMPAAAGTHVVYEIGWYEQTYSSIVKYASDGQIYEAPYIYKLRVPKIDSSSNLECVDNNPGNNNLGNSESQESIPSTPLSSSSAGYCYGGCWQYDENAKTMTWTGSGDGAEDIWQGDEIALKRIRDGWTAIFSTNVPGEIESCVLNVDGQDVINSCDGMKNTYKVTAGSFQVMSANTTIGGFRWKPANGYGYRK